MPPQLPVELVELIFDVLRAEHAVDAVPALRACAVVHSTWTRGAQSRLFRQLVIGVPAKEWNPAIQFFTVPWMSLVGSLERHPHARPLIQALEIRKSIAEKLLPRLSPILLPFVTALKWKGCAETGILEHLPALDSLEIVGCRGSRLRFPNGAPWTRPGWKGSAVSLRRLSVHFKPLDHRFLTHDLLEMLAKTRSRSTLTRLDIHLPHSTSAILFRDFMTSLTALDRLNLQCNRPYYGASSCCVRCF
jgi:hypothetical protein